jgi:hypothetical protein
VKRKVKTISQTTFATYQKKQSTIFRFKPIALVASLVLLEVALSCGSLNVGEVQPQDICRCTPLEPDFADYRHAEKHIPIPIGATETTIDTIYTWAQTDPVSLDPPRTGNELKVFHIAVAFLQEASVNSVDCDIHLEISQTADKTARRIIVETPVDSEFCSARKNIQAQLAQHGVRLDAEHGGELPQALPADVLGMAFEDFDHNAVGLQRGSPQVLTVWELHPATVSLLP